MTSKFTESGEVMRHSAIVAVDKKNLDKPKQELQVGQKLLEECQS